MSFTEALRCALGEEMARDKDVFLMGEDIATYGGAFGVTRGLVDRFGPDRVMNTPISECSFVGAAIGAAVAGSRPVVELMFMDFITLAMDPLVNQAAKLHYVFGDAMRCPLVLRTAAGAGRRYGPTHSQTLEGWLIHVPGLKVVVPSTPADARGLLKTAVRDDNPVIFIEHKGLYSTRGPVPKSGNTAIPFGKARLARHGTDLTIVTWSRMSTEAESAAELLADRGVSAELLDLRTLCPLDMDAVAASVKKTGRLLVAEEGCATGSVSAEIAMRAFDQAYDYLDAPIARVAASDTPIPASPVLEDAMIPGAAEVVDAAVALVEG